MKPAGICLPWIGLATWPAGWQSWGIILPDVILLDLTLPDLDGLNTFSKVHTNAEMVPTILLTGVDDFALALKILQQGGQDYLIKGEVNGRLLNRVIHYSIERKQAEKAIRQLAAIVELADDAVISKTREGLILSWNPAAEKLYGYSADEVMGKPIFMIVPEDRREELAGLLKRISAGEHVEHYETVRLEKRWPAGAGISDHVPDP